MRHHYSWTQKGISFFFECNDVLAEFLEDINNEELKYDFGESIHARAAKVDLCQSLWSLPYNLEGTSDFRQELFTPITALMGLVCDDLL